MKGMPLPFGFEGKGVVVLQHQETTTTATATATAAQFVVPCASKVVHFQDLLNKKRKYIEEPNSVLDNVNSSPSPPNSTSTLPSSLGRRGGGGGGDGGLAAVSANSSVKWPKPENQETSCSNVGFLEPRHQLPEQSLDIAIAGGKKCGEMEDWESVLSESGQDQSILRWIMGDVEYPSMGLNLNKMLHGGGMVDDGELTGGFGVLDQDYLGFDNDNNQVGQIGNFHQISYKLDNEKIGLSPNPQPVTTAAPPIAGHQQNPIFSQLNQTQITPFDVKPQLNQNPTLFVPFDHQTLMPPQPTRYNSGSTQYNFPNPKTPFLDSPPSIKKMAAIDELGHQGIIDQLFKAADSIQSGNNPILAQLILARLNHQLSPIGKPFKRAAFYFKEALQLLVHSIINNMNPISSPFSLIFKIGAYKSFSEVSPFVQFMNFTRNQALLEVFDGFDQVHIVDFDIGYGDQWASFMQEFALRNNNNRNSNRNRAPSLKITAFASPMNDHLQLSLTRENLVNFAKEISVGFDLEIVDIEVLASVSWSLPFCVSDSEVIAVNLPITAFPNHHIPLPSVLRFVKNLSPKIVVSVDIGCERTDLPFPNHLNHALQSYSNLLESLDAMNMNLDVLQKIERFLIQPSVEKIVSGRYSFLEKTQHWRAQFLSSGFSPLDFSNFTESQAVYLIKRTPVPGFRIERRHSSLVLCWQRLELVSASAWRC